MKPTVVICPGAWPVIKAFGPIIELLEAEGYPTQCVDFSEYRTQPFVDEALINPDCAYLRKRILMPLINEGTCIILLMHSYGGVYGASSLEALSRETRSRDGRKGGIIALVFVAAFVCLTGASLNTVLGIDMENLPRWLSFEEKTDMITYKPEYAKAMLFHDLSEEEAERAASMLPKQPAVCFYTPVHWDPYSDPAFEGRMGYVITGADRVLPMDMQQEFMDRGRIKHMYLLEDCSHSAHVERPEELFKAFESLLAAMKVTEL